MKIGIVGTGYVGLVTGACLAEMGNKVVCQDIDVPKISLLQQGKVPFYEPGLEPLIAKNISEERLNFTTDVSQLVKQKIIFFCVGTPSGATGGADLRALFAAVESVLASAESPLILVLKSTVPVGTADELLSMVRSSNKHQHAVVSNPEFLKQGSAVADFMKPDRVVIGTQDEAAGDELESIYKPFVRTGRPILRMDHHSAELTKYAANALLATRITFMNQLANLCDKVGADVEKIRMALGADTRIGPAFLFPGPGWGGSCFGKDMKALSLLGREFGAHMTLAEEALASNAKQPLVVIEKLRSALGDLNGKRIALWGLSFKPSTDDVRDAPSLVVAERLLAEGAELRVYDPKATENFLKNISSQEKITVVTKADDAPSGADALVLLTEWSAFRNPDFEKLKGQLRSPIVIDARNQYEPEELQKFGLRYFGVGRGL